MAVRTLTFAPGASVSNVVDLQQESITGMILKGAWTGADLTFLSGVNAGDLNSVFNTSGNEVQIASANVAQVASPPPAK